MFVFTIIASLIIAVPADRAVNTAIGGTPWKTISGDTARAATEGSESAKAFCGLYDASVFLPVFDAAYFTLTEGGWPAELDRLPNTHCARWEYKEAGKIGSFESNGELRNYNNPQWVRVKHWKR